MTMPDTGPNKGDNKGDNKGGNGRPILEVQGLVCSYEARGWLPFLKSEAGCVLHGVSFSVRAGETFALVGESGSGKTTVMRAVGGLLPPIGGSLRFSGVDITMPVERRTRELRRRIQIVFQNPSSSLNPRRRVSYAIGRPLEYFFGLSGRELKERVEGALRDVRLDSSYARRVPPQLSTGERQRVAIARALAAGPSLMLCDEILSSLDVSVQASIIDLLKTLQKEHDLTYLFISHDLAVVRWLAHHVGVLYLGSLCEVGTVEEVFAPPFHPYTEVLLMAVPRTVPGLRPPDLVLKVGDSRSRVEVAGCPFAPRCPRRVGPICDDTPPPLQVSETGHRLLCHIPRGELLEAQGGA